MNESESTGILRIEPYLYYEDVSAALDWLAKAFGFQEAGERRIENAVVTHAAMRYDHGVLMMGYPGPEYQSPKRSGQQTVALYVYVRDVDAHYERAKAAGAKIVEEPSNTEYGHRRYAAEDLEGQYWAFAHEIS